MVKKRENDHGSKRKTHSANFKAKVALEAYKADKTSAELIATHKVTSGQISILNDKWVLTNLAAEPIENMLALNPEITIALLERNFF